MRKFLTILLILIYTAVYTPVFAAITTQTSTISKIENDIYGFEYKNESVQNRVARLEKTIYGKASTGDINKRVKRILAPMGNEVITLVKDTSLANTIANKEIIMMAKEYSAKGLIWPLFSTAIFFLVFVGALTLLFGWAEKKLDYFR